MTPVPTAAPRGSSSTRPAPCANGCCCTSPAESEGDRAVSRLVKEALAVADIRLLDHFVAGATQHVFLAMRGWL
ncbi:JAB domain-containing protein [Stenotrophomonas nitritireducens]|uniref:JAB domain-containing protein n=1 Tax=Stenotrophomonas nitritireducens TaxID=83617 RepID=UPI003D96F6CF